MKNKFETFRATEKERQVLKTLAKRAALSKSDYIRHYLNMELAVSPEQLKIRAKFKTAVASFAVAVLLLM